VNACDQSGIAYESLSAHTAEEPVDSVAVVRTATRSLHGTANPANSEGLLTGRSSAQKMVPRDVRSPAISKSTADLGDSAPAKATEAAGRDVCCSNRATKTTRVWESTWPAALSIHMMSGFNNAKLQNHEGLVTNAAAKASH
jgi:hypothetical protein